MDSFGDLYEEINRGDGDLANVLRRAKVLTNTLQSPPGFDDWIDSELNGYTDPEDVPDYRRFLTTSFGNFYSPFRGPVYDLQILTDSLPTEVKNFAEFLIINEGVESLQSRGEEEESRPWPPDMVVSADEATKLSEDLVLHDAYQQIPASAFSEVLNQVKNRLLDFLLQMASDYDTPENTDPPEATEEPAVGPEAGGVSVTNFYVDQHLYGDRNTIATGEQVNQQVSIVHKHDAEALLDYLSEHGVEEEDLEELREALSSERPTPDGDPGPKVQAWWRKIIVKAESGLGQVGVEAANRILSDAFRAFFGS